MKEFEKLDAFMKEHGKPNLKSASHTLKLPRPSRFAPSLVAIGLAAIVTYGVIEKKKNRIEDALYLYETLSYDVTSDEIPSEYLGL